MQKKESTTGRNLTEEREEDSWDASVNKQTGGNVYIPSKISTSMFTECLSCSVIWSVNLSEERMFSHPLSSSETEFHRICPGMFFHLVSSWGLETFHLCLLIFRRNHSIYKHLHKTTQTDDIIVPFDTSNWVTSSDVSYSFSKWNDFCSFTEGWHEM